MATQRILQNHLLLWVDANVDENEANTRQTLEKLRAIVRHSTVFNTIDTAMEFLQQISKERALIMTSGFIGHELVQRVHSLPQVEAIYIFCGNVARHERWTKTWSKVRGVHNCIDPICEALETAIKQSNEDLTPISFVQQDKDTAKGGAEVDLNQLEPSFMYTTLLKRVFLDMEREPDERQALIKFCRAQFNDTNRSALKIVEEFNRDYRPDRAIWWYTRQSFLYEMLNRALRLLESDIIVDMGFFLRDLHRQLEQLHHEQFNDYDGPALTLFRGQGLPIDDFSRLKKTQGALIAFNSFLSTSLDRSVSLRFARRNMIRDGMVGILFVMTVNPKINSVTFANIESHSNLTREKEILFSMHAVFRIGQVKPMDDSQRVFEVQLTLTSDDDPELRQLTDRLENEIRANAGWQRVGTVLFELGAMDKAEELYLTLLEKTSNERDEGSYYQHLGMIKCKQGDYPRAVQYYEKAIAIGEVILSPTDPELASYYSDIGSVYSDMGEYSQALSYHNKALGIKEKTLPANHPSLAPSYNSIGSLYFHTGDYSQALSYYKKTLGILETILPPNHPRLATCYNNIGGVYNSMGEYSQALSYYKKTLGIREKILPPNHPDIAASYNNIGEVYDSLSEYSQALSYYNKTLDIWEKTLPVNHPELATSYSNIGSVYWNMSEYSQTLSYYNKALGIWEKTLPPNHPHLATLYNNIGSVYLYIGEYSQALPYYNKALDIWEKTLLANHPQLATFYNNIGMLYSSIGEYSEALSYYNKALSIKETTLPADHPDFAISYNNIGTVYWTMSEYSQTLSYFNKALAVFEKTLPPNHPHLATSYGNIGSLCETMGEHSQALFYYEKALAIQESTLPANHPGIATCYNNIGSVYFRTGKYSQALAYYEKALAIQESTLSANHSNVAQIYNNIGMTYQLLEQYSTALAYFQKALDIQQRALPPGHPDTQITLELLKHIQQKV